MNYDDYIDDPMTIDEFKEYFPKSVKVVERDGLGYEVFSKKELRWPNIPGYSRFQEFIHPQKSGSVSYSMKYMYSG